MSFFFRCCPSRPPRPPRSSRSSSTTKKPTKDYLLRNFISGIISGKWIVFESKNSLPGQYRRGKLQDKSYFIDAQQLKDQKYSEMQIQEIALSILKTSLGVPKKKTYLDLVLEQLDQYLGFLTRKPPILTQPTDNENFKQNLEAVSKKLNMYKEGYRHYTQTMGGCSKILVQNCDEGNFVVKDNSEDKKWLITQGVQNCVVVVIFGKLDRTKKVGIAHIQTWGPGSVDIKVKVKSLVDGVCWYYNEEYQAFVYGGGCFTPVADSKAPVCLHPLGGDRVRMVEDVVNSSPRNGEKGFNAIVEELKSLRIETEQVKGGDFEAELRNPGERPLGVTVVLNIETKKVIYLPDELYRLLAKRDGSI